MYSEAGNIIASKLATILSEKHGVDVVISPPVRLERAQLNLLASATQEIAEKTYVHSHAGKEVLLDALLLNYSAAKAPAEGRSV
jgi:chemotaxis protein CheY-P-specific phosphatase CheC